MTVGLPQQRTCGTMSVHYRLLTTDLTYARNRREIENRALEYARRGLIAARTGITVIPVVVHVVYNSSQPEQNISEEQIRSQIEVLNRDFRKQNSDIASIPAAFQPLATDAGIEFVLATTDPNGNPTNGITRTATTATGFADDDNLSKAPSGIRSNAVSTGAKTVKGPSPFRSSTKPATSAAFMRVLNLLALTAVSTMLAMSCFV